MTVLVQRGVLSGLDVAAQGTPNMTVSVTDGDVLFDNIMRSVTGNSALAIAAADPNLDRFDFIDVASTGTLAVTTGTAGAGPVQDSTKLSVAMVAVPARVTAIDSTLIYDLRDTNGPYGALARPRVQLPEPAQTFAYTFLSGAQSAADPGTGNLGFDAVTPGSIAHLYVNYSTPSSGVGSKRWLQGGASGTPITPWYLRLWSRTDPSGWILFQVTSFTDHSTWADLAVTWVASSSSAGGPPLLTASLDTILEWAGPVPASSPTASNGEGTLGADVTMTTAATFYDGPNTGSVGASGQVLLLIGQVTVVGGAGGVNKVTARITDGTTVFNEGEGTATASSPISISLFAIVSPSAAATYKITATSTQNSATMKRDPPDNSSGAHVATAIGWVRLA